MKKFLILYSVVLGISAGLVIGLLLVFPGLPYSLVDAAAKQAGYIREVTATDYPHPDWAATKYTPITYQEWIEGTLTPTPPPKPTKTPIETWKIPAWPELTWYGPDTGAPNDWIDWVDRIARNSAIPKPYRWEAYRTGLGIKYQDILDYYTPLLIARGYKLAFNYYDEVNTTGLVTYIRDDKKIAIEFWPETKEAYPLVLVIYKNFES